MLETLTCAAGHEWERERTRGRKPRVCPEHAGEASEAPEAPRSRRSSEAAKVLAGSTLPARCTARRILTFIEGNIDRSIDWELLEQRRREVLREVARGEYGLVDGE